MMDDHQIVSLLADDMDAAKAYQTELSAEREKFYRWYRAETYGNERPGWSQTVHPTIFSVVEWMKPGFVEVFTGDFFSFKPVAHPGEDPKAGQERAEKLKRYIRHKLFEQLDGEQVIEDFVHDCLTSHYGVLKIEQADEWDIETFDVPEATDQQLQQAYDSGQVTEAYVGSVEESVDPATGQPSTVYKDVTVTRKVQTYLGPSIKVVPARELYMLPGYTRLDQNPFVAHVVKRSLDYVRRQEMAGVYKEGSADALKDKITQTQDLLESTGEAQLQALVDNLSSPLTGQTTPQSDPRRLPAGEVWVWECYVKLDTDGTGLLKPCIVTLCEDVVLRGPVENPYGSPPFELGHIYKEPHNIVGRPIPAILDSRQRVMTNLLRGIQDAAAMSTYRGFLTTDARTKKMLGTMGPGDVGLVSSLGESALLPIDPGSPTDFILSAFQLTGAEVSKETGINENQQGLDANSLNKTAAAMEMRLTAGMQRQKLYARRIARTFKRVLRRVLDIIRRFPPQPDAQTNGDIVSLSPEDVSGMFSVDIDVGVGPQDRMAYAQMLDQLVGWMVQVGLPQGMVTPEMMIRAILAKHEYMDMDVSEFLPPPEKAPGMMQAMQQLQQLQAENQAMKQAIEEARYQDAMASEANRLKQEQMERDFVLKSRELDIKEKDSILKMAQTMGQPAMPGVPGAMPPPPPGPGRAPMSSVGMPPAGPMAGPDALEAAIQAQAMADLQRVNQAPPVPQAPPINVMMGPGGQTMPTPQGQSQNQNQGQSGQAPASPLPR